ncbi:MAG: efflux RND transporter permease subunit, partial [Actinobacteria bacterium]|nr:efflux RND transporter permease subunit [Actinomycetota bacterium]
MSWLTKMSLRNRSIVGLVVVAVIIFGAIAVPALKQELMPDLTLPYLTVFTVDQGTSASDIERTVTAPLEQTIKTVSGVKEYDSFSNEGMSIITVQFEFGTDMKAKETEVQQAVAGAQLSQTALPPSVAALNFNSMPVVQLAVSSSLPPQELATQLGTQVVPVLQGVPGVQAVTLSGVEQMQLQIQLKPAKVVRLGVDTTQIATTIQQANLTTGAGTVTSGSLVYPITVSARAQTVEAIKKLVIAPASASPLSAAAAATSGATAAASTASAVATTTAAPPVTLGEIADVRIAPAPLTAITRTNGKSSIGISISKSSTGNTVDIANAVADELPALTRNLGGKTKIATVVDQSIYVKESITSLWQEGLIGAVFAVLIIWVFLRSWRSTLIASLSIPLSIVGALIILFSRGES